MTETVVEGYLTPPELAKRWKMSEWTLANWRSSKKGPKYVKLGFAVIYDIGEIEDFEKANPQLLKPRKRRTRAFLKDSKK